MKTLSNLLLAGLVFLGACSKSSKNADNSSTLGGDGNLPSNAVGYNYLGSSNIPGVTATLIKVMSNNNGEVTLHIKATLPNPGNTLTNLIPAELKDEFGNIDVTGKFKNTTEGILDYTNSDGKPFVVVKYDANVGEKYVLTKSNGKTITRTVTSKSTTDDFPYGFMYIKVMKVEQDSRIPGISKIRYIANHHYGLVAVQIEMEDGTTKTINII